ncbi:phosphate acyltransferase PlsX [Mycoplasmopsis bovis]|uniref:Phosphate acyltransferase n=3 Tax=Mycoplasmopsis bovis TaxID=28903 RepID=A0A2N8U245_MYCBV|nr:phosphate acyltransferase PlsX [Mycoplasmopsis bovis]ADR25245.1 fatty acid/phospholipid synthesis protein PlsX [Mycoplasmopsis bovis PG45]AEI90023.1 putative glycerol-3-phosphate acyltransferase PlsX [Mycoplasmopsis bovis Hubei-1]AFM51700.1 glycerol-3-phosphate acyltransferase plsX [Mycoplasmopsis bovis HB0801]AIA33897.1 phosphate acyltransferase [Mycoplasmopsis bovis CQ-W70]AKO50523.1 phosphate acyltransferase [Mycoplasmopsis bovis]
MYRIAFDVNGNDNGVSAAVSASVQFLKDNDDYEIILVGDESSINVELKKIEGIPDSLRIVNNPNLPSDVKNIHKSLRENTSMNTAIDLVVDGKADAVISSGDSGTYLACATFKLKRLQGVSRSAFMPLMPTVVGRKFLLLDVGANIECKSEYLVEWAKIANVYARTLLNIVNPRVSLINIGTEDYKGLEIVKEASQLLKDNKFINYIGYTEPRYLLDGATDVAVIDGYGGNLVLKSLEGAILSFKNLLKDKIMAKPIRKFGYLFLKGAFKDVAETLDYRNVGAAWLIGLNGLSIKCHGNSDTKAYLGALNQIKLVIKNNVLEAIKKELNDQPNE